MSTSRKRHRWFDWADGFEFLADDGFWWLAGVLAVLAVVAGLWWLGGRRWRQGHAELEDARRFNRRRRALPR